MMVSRCAALACLSLAAACAMAGPSDMPKRKPGLWKIDTKMAGMPSMGPVQQCIDSATDNLFRQMGEDAANKCAPPEIRHDGDRVAVHTVCKMDKTTATTNAVFTGKFDSAYRGDIDISYDPPMHGMAKARMSIDASWTGPCKPGQKPGDIVMANGQTISADQMKQATERAKAMRQQMPPR